MPLAETPLPIDRDPMKCLPKIDVSEKIAATLTVHPCSLREVSLFGRGYIPGTSAVDISASYKSGSYQDFLISNLPLETYQFLLEKFAEVFKCSPDELKRIGYLCYNVRRGFGTLSDVPNLPFQVAKEPNNYISGVGNVDGNLWVCSGK